MSLCINYMTLSMTLISVARPPPKAGTNKTQDSLLAGWSWERRKQNEHSELVENLRDWIKNMNDLIR